MTLFSLVWANLWKHKIRTALSMAAVAVAILLIVILRSVVTSLDDAVKQAASNRIVVQSAVSLFVNLPFSYKDRIAGVEGVESVSRLTWFGGYYKDPADFFAQFAVDAATYLDQYPEIILPPEQREAFLKDRTSCILGINLAKRLEKDDINVGSTLPLTGAIYPQEGGWQLKVAGIYDSSKLTVDLSTCFFHSEFLEEGRKKSDDPNYTSVGVYLVRVKEGYRSEDVAQAIDRLFLGGPQKTLTQTEAAFNAGFVTMQGNIPGFMLMIGSAVFFAILLTMVNTMLISARERVRDVGILKALGFRPFTIAFTHFLEAALLTSIGGGFGLFLAYRVVNVVRESMGGALFQSFDVRPATAYLALSGMGLMIFLSGMVPAVNSWRLKAVTALRMEV